MRLGLAGGGGGKQPAWYGVLRSPNSPSTAGSQGKSPGERGFFPRAPPELPDLPPDAVGGGGKRQGARGGTPLKALEALTNLDVQVGKHRPGSSKGRQPDTPISPLDDSAWDSIRIV